jgi:hypothetical protein
MSLLAAIDVPPGQVDSASFWVNLRISNPTGATISILNPDMGTPSAAAKWTASQNAYQISLLISFGFLSMSVTDEAGKEHPRERILTSATPALRPPLELRPGDSFEVAVPIGYFHRLRPKKAYRIVLEYGDRTLKVSADARVIAP